MNAVANTSAGRRSLFTGYTDTVATAAEETGTCWFVVANTVKVYDPDGYCLKTRKAVTFTFGAAIIEAASTSTVLPAESFSTPRTWAVKLALPVLT